MNDNMISGNYRIAVVNFVRGTNTEKEYAFACFDDELNVGDFVLCDTSHGYGVAKIVDFRLKDFWSSIPITKEIICKLDFSAFEKRKELRKQKDALKKQMDKMVADNQELILYQAIAEKNPEMAAMLAEYKSLANV